MDLVLIKNASRLKLFLLMSKLFNGTHIENDIIEQINSLKKHPALDLEVSKNVKFSKFEKLGEEINKKMTLLLLRLPLKELNGPR